MNLLTRDQILAADDLTTEDHEVPEWGGTVRIRMLTGTERDAFEASVTQQRGKSVQANLTNLRARLVSLCLIDATGRRMFNREDIPALGRKSAAALDRVFDACRRLNRIGDEDVEELTEGFPGTAATDGEPSSTA